MTAQAKGRIERFFETAQDRLVKGLRLAGAADMDAANLYLAGTFLPEWEQRFTVAAANATDGHRPLTKLHNLAAALSRVEMRTITSDYTLAYAGQRYQIARSSLRPAMKGHQARVEARLDGTVAVRFEGQYLDISAALLRAPQPSTDAMSPSAQGPQSRRAQSLDERSPDHHSKAHLAGTAGRQSRQLRRSAGQNQPGDLRFSVQSLCSGSTNREWQNKKAPFGIERLCRSRSEPSVASALDTRLGATPGG